MKKHLLSIIASIVICALLLIGCGGGSSDNIPSEPTELMYSTQASSRGTFWLISKKSGAVVESTEEYTLPVDSSIVLKERTARSNESKLFGGNSSNIYTLQAKNGNQTITKLEKPIKLTIPNNFDKEFKKFFIGSKSESASDWQYTQILDDNETNQAIVGNARFAIKDLNTFIIEIYRFGFSFVIFALKDSNKPTNFDYVRLMAFSSDPSTVYYNKNSKYTTNIKVSTCITANKSSTLFDRSEVTSQIVFFNDSPTDLSGLKIDSTTAIQSSSTTKDSSNNQYSHTLYIKSYKKNNISISGNNATYSFDLKLNGVTINDFPDSFIIKTVLKDVNGTEFAAEGSIKLKREINNGKTDTYTNTSTGSATSTDTETNTNSGTSTTIDTNTNTGSSTNTNSNTNTSTETNSGSSTNTATNTGSSTDTNSNTNTATDTNTGSNTSTETNTQTSTNTDTSSSTNTATNTSTATTTEISVSFSPTNSETNKIEVTTPIKITFNEKMDKTQNLLTLVTLICNSTTTNLITASNQLEWSTENNKDVLTVKNTKLNPEQSYTIKLNSGLKTESGLTSTNQISSNFVTRDRVALNVTNPTSQNSPLNARIEVTPIGGSISNIENASIRFNSEGKAGSFSLENGKVYFSLTSGTTWKPQTYYAGTISGILDSDGCETKPCDFSFTTRDQTIISFQPQISYHARSSLTFIVENGTITDISTARISYSNGNIDCSLSLNNGNIICSLAENDQWVFNSNSTITISNLKDSEGAPVAESSANFNIGAQTYLSCNSTSIKANSDLVFTVNGTNITSLTNANVSFTGANVSGNLQLDNGKIVYRLANNSLYPFGSNITIDISGLKDSNGVTVADLSQSFYVDSQTEIEDFTKSENLGDNILFTHSSGFTGWNISNAAIAFDNANVSGSLAVENRKLIYKLNDGYYYPHSIRVTGRISGIKDSDDLPVKDFDFSFDTIYYTGNGTEDNPFLISSAEELDNIRYLKYGNGGSNETIPFFKQIQNIDLSNYGQYYDNGKGWKPIQNNDDEEAFFGYYDGNNYKITNLYINRPSEYVGIFKDIRGKIINIGVEISSRGITGSVAGGISGSICFAYGYGQNDIDSTVTNCWVKGNGVISCSQIGGGLFGYFYNRKITNCYSNINIESTGSNDSCIGGLIGEYSNLLMVKCYSKGFLNSNGSAGGLVGNNTEGCTIKSSFSNAIINCAKTGGGLVAYSYSASIYNCYATGNVIGEGDSSCGRIGGLVGSSRVCHIENSYSTGKVEGKRFIGGILGYHGDLLNGFCLVQNCVANNLKAECVTSSDDYAINRVANRMPPPEHGDAFLLRIINCYANKDMTLTINGVSTQPGLQEPLPDTVALDGVDGANLPDNPDWKNDIFKDGYENGESFDSVWEIGTSGLPILKNMPGNPVQ